MTLSKYAFLLVGTVGCGLFVVGCGSSESADREWSAGSPMDTTELIKKTGFETRTDTVTTQAAGQQNVQTSAFSSTPVRFAVQVGAFSFAKNASAAQILARQRYSHTVVSDYNAARRIYQIRIGFFETKIAANDFRLQLINDHPADYKEAWVVQITK